jgi:methyl-accepting chemotaxis protein
MGGINVFNKLKIRGKLIATHFLAVLICVGIAYSGLPIYAVAGAGLVAAFAIALLLSKDLAPCVVGPTKVIRNLGQGEIVRTAKAKREKMKQRGDEFAAFSFALDDLDAYFDRMIKAAEEIAAGNLTIEVTPKSPKDEQGVAFSKMVHNLRNMVGQVAGNANNLAASTQDLLSYSHLAGESTQQIASTIQQVARGAGEQTRAVTESAMSVDQMNQSIERVAINAQSVASASAQASSAAKSGAETVGKSVKAMESIKDAIEPAAAKVKELGDRSAEIGNIIEVIDDIAEQTNLLALNAAIEAARAGEHGKGFAVVADEVRKLAERSSKATKEITNLVTTVQKGTEQAVTAMVSGVQEVEHGSTLALEAGKSLEEILKAIETTNQQVQAISAAANEMKAFSTSVVRSIDNISSISEENAAAAEEVSASTEETAAQVEQMGTSVETLSQVARQLEELVAQFKLQTEANVTLRRRDGDWAKTASAKTMTLAS